MVNYSKRGTQPAQWSVHHIMNGLADGTPTRKHNRQVLTMHRKLLMLQFREWFLAQGRIHGDDYFLNIYGPRSFPIGSQEWLLQFFYFINRYDPSIEFGDVQRWAKAHKWITQIDQVPRAMEKYWNEGQEELTTEGRDVLRKRCSTPPMHDQFMTNATDTILQSPVRTYASPAAAPPPPPRSIPFNDLPAETTPRPDRSGTAPVMPQPGPSGTASVTNLPGPRVTAPMTLPPGPSGTAPGTPQSDTSGMAPVKPQLSPSGTDVTTLRPSSNRISNPVLPPPTGLTEDEVGPVSDDEMPVLPMETSQPNNTEGPEAETSFEAEPSEPDPTETVKRFQTVYQNLEKIASIMRDNPLYAGLFNHVDNMYRVVHRNHWRKVIPVTHQEAMTRTARQIKRELVEARNRKFDSSTSSGVPPSPEFINVTSDEEFIGIDDSDMEYTHPCYEPTDVQETTEEFGDLEMELVEETDTEESPINYASK